MMFRRDLAEAVMAGTKRHTRRLVRHDKPRSPWAAEGCAYKVGQRITINPGRGVYRIGYAEVTSVERGLLGHLTDAQARDEGFPDAAAFEAGFAKINGGTYDPTAEVWTLGLRPLERV